ncbi:MAG: hypothetical protein Q4E57_04620 [Eubacteriales bacterium]|nr:hypothetical protein [Eubacteriales bacterium]
MTAIGILLKIAQVLLIIVGVLLAAVILLLIMILFFWPVRYYINGSFKDNTPDGEINVKWIMGLVRAKAAYHKGEKLKAYVKVAWIKVYDFFPDEGESDGYDGVLESDILDGGFEDGFPGESGEPGYYIGSEDDPHAGGANAETGAGEAGGAAGGDEDGGEATEAKAAAFAGKKQGIFEKLKAAAEGVVRSIKAEIAALKKKVHDAAEAGINKLKALWQKAAETFINIRDNVTDKKAKAEKLYALYKDERYQDAVMMVKKRVVRLLKEIAPTKGRGRVRYGGGDPFATGQAMQAAAMLYPFYHKHIEVIPDFDQNIIDAELDVRGRIRIFVVAEAAIRIFFSKKLRRMYKKARKILELD